MRTFSERLKSAMEEANLKQSALAAMVGVSKGAMSGYVSGKVNPRKRRRNRLPLPWANPLTISGFWMSTRKLWPMAATGCP